MLFVRQLAAAAVVGAILLFADFNGIRGLFIGGATGVILYGALVLLTGSMDVREREHLRLAVRATLRGLRNIG